MIEIKAIKFNDGVKFYNDLGAIIAYFPKEYSNCPDYRYKFVTLNCCKYRILWIK